MKHIKPSRNNKALLHFSVVREAGFAKSLPFGISEEWQGLIKYRIKSKTQTEMRKARERD